MDTFEVLTSRRSIRQFEGRDVPRDVLMRCLEAARLAPTSANRQPLEFVAVIDRDRCEQIFPHLRWAGDLRDWSPSKEKQPRAYIAIVVNKKRALEGFEQYDIAFAASNIVHVALAEGIASCLVGAFNVREIGALLNIPRGYAFPLIVALGYPAEKAVVEDFTGSHKYWRDEAGVHHVPKRRLDDIVHWESFKIASRRASGGPYLLP